MSDQVDVSVVIGFRNWGQRRLLLAIRSIQESFGDLNGEVIVSDYGSDDGQVREETVRAEGARYLYTATDGTWSRSRALNAGFAVSRGKVLISTDADMIFSPKSFQTLGSLILADSKLCLLLQCRDLPASWSDEEVEANGFQWETFERVSRLRPRWGMGGMMAVHRDVFERIRGLDERMHTYGGEDIDFATRARRAGQKLLWVDEPEVRMYHMWHPSSRTAAESTDETKAAVAANKDIVYNDKTVARNISKWQHRLPGAKPLVSVAIATRNRSHYLRESIISVLGQTMQDFEIVVVDDGSDDTTRQVVEDFADTRIRYIYQEQAGVAVARNRAADEARGYFTAVHDDDDLMTPWRLESQLKCLDTGMNGSFGSFVNFDDSSGDMVLFRSKALNPGTIDESGGAPGHGTWLIETDIIRRLRYDESLSSGVDNNLALRIVRSGFKMVHSGEILMLRRMHPGQITAVDEHMQKLAARQTRAVFSFLTTAWGSKKMKEQRGADDWTPIRFADQLEQLEPYLPDHLVDRILVAHAPDPFAESGVAVYTDGEYQGRFRADDKITQLELARLSSAGENPSIQTQRRLASLLPEAHLGEMDHVTKLRRTAAAIAEELQERHGNAVWVIDAKGAAPEDMVLLRSVRLEIQDVIWELKFFLSAGEEFLGDELVQIWDRLVLSQLPMPVADAAKILCSHSRQDSVVASIGERA